LNPFQNIYDAQKVYFATGVTRGYEWRVEQLDRMARLLSDFRTPAAGARGQIIVAGVRKPAQSTKGDLPLSTNHLRVLSYQMLG
jgi:hypothetical protein